MSFYYWKNLRIMAPHKVHKSLPGIQKSWVTSRCWALLNKAKWAETCKIMYWVQPYVMLRLQIYLQQQNRLQHQPTFHLLNEYGHFYKRYSYKEKKLATKQILLMLHLKWSVWDKRVETNCSQRRDDFQLFKSRDISAGYQPLIRPISWMNL